LVRSWHLGCGKSVLRLFRGVWALNSGLQIGCQYWVGRFGCPTMASDPADDPADDLEMILQMISVVVRNVTTRDSFLPLFDGVSVVAKHQ